MLSRLEICNPCQNIHSSFENSELLIKMTPVVILRSIFFLNYTHLVNLISFV